MGLVGFIISMSTLNVAARYIALFLQAGSYAGFIVFYSWISSSFPRPPAKRAVALALINAFSQLGNVAGSYVYPSKWAPSYLQSFGIALSCFVACMVGSTYHMWTLRRLNKRFDEQDARGDRNILNGIEFPNGFRYVL